ncbi:MAG: hypothetical protein QMC40_08000 [Vicingaceae bacterium]
MKTSNFKTTLLNALAISVLSFPSCKDDEEVVIPRTIVEEYTATINLTQLVDGADFRMNTTDYPYENAMRQKFKVTKLQYLISDITFSKDDATTVTDPGYHYVDLTNAASLSYTLATKIPAGTYSSIGFTFGFDQTDNVTGEYQDLNTIGWNWPAMLGGGYHFLRLEGGYLDSTNTPAEFKSHMGTARDNSTTPPTFEVNHFDVTLANSNVSVSTNFSFDIEMNIEEWYANPITWDFNVWNAPIMPIFGAQKALNTNGSSVFTFKK